MREQISEEAFTQWADNLFKAAADTEYPSKYPLSYEQMTNILRTGVTEWLGVEIIQPFTDGQIVFVLTDSSRFLRLDGRWCEVTRPGIDLGVGRIYEDYEVLEYIEGGYMEIREEKP